jgi:hypothetical protein
MGEVQVTEADRTDEFLALLSRMMKRNGMKIVREGRVDGTLPVEPVRILRVVGDSAGLRMSVVGVDPATPMRVRGRLREEILLAMAALYWTFGRAVIRPGSLALVLQERSAQNVYARWKELKDQWEKAAGLGPGLVPFISDGGTYRLDVDDVEMVRIASYPQSRCALRWMTGHSDLSKVFSEEDIERLAAARDEILAPGR